MVIYYSEWAMKQLVIEKDISTIMKRFAMLMLMFQINLLPSSNESIRISDGSSAPLMKFLVEHFYFCIGQLNSIIASFEQRCKSGFEVITNTVP